MGNSKTNGFFTPEKFLYGIIQGLPPTLRGLAFIFFLVAFYFFPAFWDLCGVLRGTRGKGFPKRKSDANSQHSKQFWTHSDFPIWFLRVLIPTRASINSMKYPHTAALVRWGWQQANSRIWNLNCPFWTNRAVHGWAKCATSKVFFCVSDFTSGGSAWCHGWLQIHPQGTSIYN